MVQGKTTLISIICGIVKPSSGKVTVDNFDIIDDYRETRARIGLVPQELTLEQFETVFNNSLLFKRPCMEKNQIHSI
jgi:ABC-2 type transport system ATP-binding protein